MVTNKGWEKTAANHIPFIKGKYRLHLKREHLIFVKPQLFIVNLKMFHGLLCNRFKVTGNDVVTHLCSLKCTNEQPLKLLKTFWGENGFLWGINI